MKHIFIFTFIFGLARSGILPETPVLYNTPSREFQQGDIDVRTLQSGSFISDNKILDGESHVSGLSLVGNLGTAEVGGSSSDLGGSGSFSHVGGQGIETGTFSGSLDGSVVGDSFSTSLDSSENSGVQFPGRVHGSVLGGSGIVSSSDYSENDGNHFKGGNEAQIIGGSRLEGSDFGSTHFSGNIGVPLVGDSDILSSFGVISGENKLEGSQFGGTHFSGNIGVPLVGGGDILSSSGVTSGGISDSQLVGGSIGSGGSFKGVGLQAGISEQFHESGISGDISGGISGIKEVTHGSGFGAKISSGNTGLQGSISGGESLFNNFLGGIAIPIPTPSGRGGDCKPNIVVQTVQVTSTVGVPSTVYNEVVTTITRISTTAVIFPQTSISIQTVVSTVFDTQFATITRTVFNTETRTSEIRQPAQTVFSTVTQTMISTVFRESTAYVTSTNVIPTTVFSNHIIRTTLTKFQTRFITNAVTQTLPGQTQFQTQFQTNTQFVTQTIPGQTIINTRTVYSTIVQNVVSTLPAQRSTIFSTEVIPLVSTVYKTQFVTQTQTQFVERTQFQTQIQSAFSTYYVTSTQYRDQVITQSSERVRTSILTIPTQIVSTVESTRFQNRFQTQYVTDTRKQVITITAPGQQIPVYQTTTVYSQIVSTSYYTNNAVNAVTVTRTVQGNCGAQVTQTGYNYNNPNQPFNFLS